MTETQSSNNITIDKGKQKKLLKKVALGAIVTNEQFENLINYNIQVIMFTVCIFIKSQINFHKGKY